LRQLNRRFDGAAETVLACEAASLGYIEKGLVTANPQWVLQSLPSDGIGGIVSLPAAFMTVECRHASSIMTENRDISKSK
jgi:hypothetical protein